MPKKTPQIDRSKMAYWENPDTIGHRFKKNLYCSTHKSSNQKFREGWERTFGKTNNRSE